MTPFYCSYLPPVLSVGDYGRSTFATDNVNAYAAQNDFASTEGKKIAAAKLTPYKPANDVKQRLLLGYSAKAMQSVIEGAAGYTV